jgi:hypothetical protein
MTIPPQYQTKSTDTEGFLYPKEKISSKNTILVLEKI